MLEEASITSINKLCGAVATDTKAAMLDDNLPSFVIKPSPDNELFKNVLLGRAGTFEPEYNLRRPDPKLPASKNCYALGLYDSYSQDVLYAEVLVHPEWTQPTLSQAEIRAHNGASPPPIPIVPNNFTIQLYNPDQQVVVKQIAGTWNSSAHWEFKMPQQTFRLPSASALDRSQDDPAASPTTPKVTFKWKRDGKLTKDLACYMVGKSTDGKKSKEPDITVAMFKHDKELTIYEPNMHRVDVEDAKGLEVVILLGAIVIKDIFFNANRELFNISGTPPATARKNSNGPVIPGTSRTSPQTTAEALQAPSTSNIPSSQVANTNGRSHAQPTPSPRPPPADPRTQWEIDSETARLRALVEAEERERERERERVEREEERRIKLMLAAEEKEQKRREAEIAKETERLRKQYGTEPIRAENTHLKPSLKNRPDSGSKPSPQSQQFSQYQSAPHSMPQPTPRPQSTPTTGALGGPVAGPSTSFGGPMTFPPQDMYRPSNTGGLNQPEPKHDKHKLLGIHVGGKKMQKKRSVFF